MDNCYKMLIGYIVCLLSFGWGVSNFIVKPLREEYKESLRDNIKYIIYIQTLQDNLAICKIIKQESVLLPPKVGEYL